MGLSNQDVEMLNNSMRYAGGAFRQSRLDAEQLKQQQIENELRERTLKAGQDRTDLAAAGEVNAYLSGEDGGLVEYKGSPQGLQKVMSEAEAKGKPLRQVSAPQKRASIGTFTTQTPLGQFTFHLNEPEEVDKISALAKQIGGSNKQPGESKTAPIMNDEHLAKLEEAVAAAQNPEEKARAEYVLKRFRELLPTRTDADMETVTEEFPGQEATPEVPPQTKGMLWWKHEVPGTGQPAKPAVPPRKVSYKQPRGTASSTPPAAQAEPPPMPVPQTATTLTAPAKTDAAKKAALANELAKQHPTWTREQIIAEVNKQFTK